jgi:uncharacterized small protein (DUF1192 family)
MNPFTLTGFGNTCPCGRDATDKSSWENHRLCRDCDTRMQAGQLYGDSRFDFEYNEALRLRIRETLHVDERTQLQRELAEAIDLSQQREWRIQALTREIQQLQAHLERVKAERDTMNAYNKRLVGKLHRAQQLAIQYANEIRAKNVRP